MGKRYFSNPTNEIYITESKWISKLKQSKNPFSELGCIIKESN